MKILIHIPQLIYGGAEKVLVDFANFLVQKGHDVEILETYEKGFLKPHFDGRVKFNAICSKEYTKKYYASPSDIRQEKNFSKKFLLLTKFAFSKLVGYRRFAERLAANYYKERKYDVAINYLEIESPNFILNIINAKKYIQWIHIDVKKLDENEINPFIKAYNRMDAIICVSQTAREAFCDLYPNMSKKTYVIYNFFNVSAILKSAQDKNIVYSAENNILSIGRMTEQKAYLRSIEVVNRLVKEGYSFKWRIMGEGADREDIEAKISEYDLDGYIELLGIKDNPYPYIRGCDLFFLPSLYEGFPTVTIEAKILNKPVLATDVSGIREQIEDGKQGLIVENSEEGIYKGLKKILDNPSMLVDLSRNDGMEKVLNNEIKYSDFMEIVK